MYIYILHTHSIVPMKYCLAFENMFLHLLKTWTILSNSHLIQI